MMPLLAIRGRGANSLIVGHCDPEIPFQENAQQPIRDKKLCRFMKFNHNGTMFVYCNSEETRVVDTETLKVLKILDIAKACGFHFSPNDSILCILEPYLTSKEYPEGKKNLKIYETMSWKCIAEVKQKSQLLWHPSWFGDSDIFARMMTNNLFFYSGSNFDNVVAKLKVEKLENFSVTPKSSPRSRIAAFARGTKGAPSSVRLFEYPNFNPDQVLANKSFFKADTVTLHWNAKGSAILIRAATEVDSTGASYYGEQSLHYMHINGDTSIIQLPKNGPIYDVAWDPDATKFCVTYGFMPAKASIFNLKCNIIHDFGPSPKNTCFYNPHGNILLLAGFGNLRGNIEVWHNSKLGIKALGHLEAPDTTQLEWCPDGVHFVTATTAPRLRVNNGYKIWHYAKKAPITDQRWDTELHEVLWQPCVYQMPEILMSSSMAPKMQVKPQSYIPPHARGRSDYSAAKFKSEEEENTKEEILSKSAMKNKKKREAAKKKKDSPSTNMTSSQQDAVAMAKYLLGDNRSELSSGMSETEKKIKNLKKKLQNIKKLKQQQRDGKLLEKNQIEKLATESDIVAQLQGLGVN